MSADEVSARAAGSENDHGSQKLRGNVALVHGHKDDQDDGQKQRTECGEGKVLATFGASFGSPVPAVLAIGFQSGMGELVVLLDVASPEIEFVAPECDFFTLVFEKL